MIKIISNKYGQALIDINNPQITDIWLREKDGTLSKDNILNKRSYPWQGAYTYVISNDNIRYESRMSKEHTYKIITKNYKIVGVEFSNIELMSQKGEKAPLVQKWKILIEDELTWKIETHWMDDFDIRLSGSPSMFLGEFGGCCTQSPKEVNHVTSTLWYNPDRLYAEYLHEYKYSFQNGYGCDVHVSDNTAVTVMDKNAWAIYKLFTTFDLQSDIYLKAEDGYLIRRAGSSASFSEIGLSVENKMAFSRKKGNIDVSTLIMRPRDKYESGHNMYFKLPKSEAKIETLIKDFYSSLFNGGIIADQKDYNFGNASDGCIYTGVTWAHGYNLFAGLTKNNCISQDPFSMANAFKKFILNAFKTVRPDGLTELGYNGVFGAEGVMIDENLIIIIGAYMYYLYTGDIGFVKFILPYFEDVVKIFINNIKDNGLFKNPIPGSHWYYDAMRYEGYNTYLNTILYRSLFIMSEFYSEINDKESSYKYERYAENLKNAINTVLWNEDAPNGPRYSDWIQSDGVRKEYFVDLCQYSTIVYGVADQEKAKKIFATADKRIAELKATMGYSEYASVSNLWDIDDRNVNFIGFPFGEYMNGGSFLLVTFYEIVGRCLTGDAKGAYYRLNKFFEGYEKTRYYGTNGCNMKGDVAIGGEAYLGDMVTISSSMIYGFLGINPTCSGLNIKPALPYHLKSGVSCEIIFKGDLYKIEIKEDKIDLRKIKKVFFENGFIPNSVDTSEKPNKAIWCFNELTEPAQNSLSSFYTAKHYLNRGKIKEVSDNIKRGQDGVDGYSYYFMKVNDQVGAHLNVYNSFNFDKKTSFTLYARVKIDIKNCLNAKTEKGVSIVSKQPNFHMTIQQNKAVITLIDDSGNTVRIAGKRDIFNSDWHLIKAEINRKTNVCNLFVDDILENSADISVIGNFCSPKILVIAEYKWINDSITHVPGSKANDENDPGAFVGWIDEIGIVE